jgi:hypothetical protein
LLNQVNQLVFFEGLLDEIHGTLFHGVHRHGHIAVTGDEDDGQGRVRIDQAVLQLQAGHAIHADVHNQAGHFARVVATQKRLGGVEAAYTVVLAFQKPLQGVAHSFVVIDHVDRTFFRDQTHFFIRKFARSADGAAPRWFAYRSAARN